MRHVTDGEIHAFLDGSVDLLEEGRGEEVRQHLAECSVCKERLQDEEAVRDQARTILGEEVPTGLELPSFEELRERAEALEAVETRTAKVRDETVRYRGPLRGFPLAWAATIVLALGVGWMGGQVWRGLPSQGGPRPAVPLYEDAATVDPDRAVLEAQEEASTERGREGDDQEQAADARDEAISAPPPPLDPPLAGVQSLSDQGQAVPVTGHVPQDTQTVSTAVREFQDERAPAGVPPDSVRSETDSSLSNTGELAMREPLALEGLVVRAVVDPRPPDSVEGAGAARQRGEPTMDVRPEAGLERPRVDPNMDWNDPFTLPDSVEGSLAVPGLQVVSIGWEERIPGEKALLIRQLLSPGDTLELRYLGMLLGVEREAGRDSKAVTGMGDPRRGREYANMLAASLPAHWHQVVMERGRRLLVARAPLSEANLKALLKTLR